MNSRTSFLIPSEVTTCSSGCWLCVSFTGVERQLSTPQVPWLHQRQPGVLRRKRDCTLPSSSQRRHVPRRKRERPSSSQNRRVLRRRRNRQVLTMWVCTSEEEGQAFFLAMSVSTCSLCCRANFDHWVHCFLMHCECKNMLVAGSPRECLERGAPTLRMRMLTRAILTSVNNSNHVSMFPSAFGPGWQDTPATRCWGTMQTWVRWSPRRTWKRTLQLQVGEKELRLSPGFVVHDDF